MPIDYANYPPGWFTDIRPSILKRDGHKCRFCARSNGQIVQRIKVAGKIIWFDSLPAFLNSGLARPSFDYSILKPCKVVLTIAHLDHDEKNWNVHPARLAALCQRCHLRYDAKNKAAKRKTNFLQALKAKFKP